MNRNNELDSRALALFIEECCVNPKMLRDMDLRNPKENYILLCPTDGNEVDGP